MNAGALVGGAVGAVVGHQFGEGKGKDLATAAGAVGGAVIGQELQQRSQQQQAAAGPYRVHIRMPNGELRSFTQDSVSGLQVGERVRVEGDRIWW